MKVVLHCHSTWSYDGRWQLPAIARLFGGLGVDAVMMTEHDTGFRPEQFQAYRQACAAASTSRCRLVPGIEYSCPENDIHLLTWGLDRFFAEHRPVGETLERVRLHGGVAILAHPVRHDAWRLFDQAWVSYLAGIEIWNRKSDGLVWGSAAAQLIAEHGLPATVGMDFHRARQLYPLTNLIDPSNPEELEPALIAALAAGRQIPMAFGRPLLDRERRPRPGLHLGLERARRATLRRLRGTLDKQSH